MTRWMWATLLAAFLVAAFHPACEIFKPDVAELARKNPETTAFMELRKAQWQKEGKKTRLRWKWVPYEQISPYLIQAVTIAEDDGFWKHKGLDLSAARRALEVNLGRGRAKFGGSTITQQLAKNLFLTPDKTLRRKAVEAAIAVRMERALTKKRILEIYLNVVEWGDGVFGAQAAARRWFGVSAGELTPMQAARLAAALPSPLKMNPAMEGGYVERRAGQLAAEMRKRGLAPEE